MPTSEREPSPLATKSSSGASTRPGLGILFTLLGHFFRALITPTHPRVEERNLAKEILAILSSPDREATFSLLLDKLHSPSTTALTKTLTDLLYDRKIEKVIRVESPGGGGLGEFKSFVDIPNTIVDWRTDRVMEIHPDNLVTIFRMPSRGDEPSDITTKPQGRRREQDARQRA